MAKAPAHLRSLARAHTEASVQRIAGLAEAATSESVRLDANKALLDRGWGSPLQKHGHGGGEDGEGPIIVQVMYQPRAKK